jgi:hypothetical protein
MLGPNVAARFWCLMGLLLVSGQVAATRPVGRPRLDVRATRQIGCLLTKDWVQDDLRKIGLTVGRHAVVRYRLGSILGTEPRTPTTLNIIIYSTDRRHAWLFFARGYRGGKVAAVRNAYALELDGETWVAGEGNGGIGTYEAVGRFATDVAKGPAFRVRLTPATEACPTEE